MSTPEPDYKGLATFWLRKDPRTKDKPKLQEELVAKIAQALDDRARAVARQGTPDHTNTRFRIERDLFAQGRLNSGAVDEMAKFLEKEVLQQDSNQP